MGECRAWALCAGQRREWAASGGRSTCCWLVLVQTSANTGKTSREQARQKGKTGMRDLGQMMGDVSEASSLGPGR